MASSLIVGMGEIGRAVREVITSNDKVVTYDKTDDDFYFDVNPDILHICFPYSEVFLEEVSWYIDGVKPWHVIIWSTVPIGTTKQIKGAVHSPVEGKHPQIATSIKNSTRWLGANDLIEGEFFANYFKMLFMKTKVIYDSDHTEALKLLSTTEYGLNIEFARYKKQVANKIGMDYQLTKEWNRDYNKLYHNLHMDWAQKYVLDAPSGPKGGHCVTPNAQFLHDQYPDELVRIVGEL